MSSTADYSNQQFRHDQSRAPEYGARNRAPEYGDTPHVTETATEARQGVTGQGVSTVLVVSTVAVILCFAGVYAFFFA